MDSLSLTLSPHHQIIIAAVALLISGLIFRRVSAKRLNLPPSPPGWPIVGNLFQVARYGKPFFQYVHDTREKYGNIFTLKMGTRTLIVISSADLVHEALIEKGQVFATRPRENPTRNIFSANKFTVNASMYGPVWRALRRNMVQNGLSTSRLKEFVKVRVEAMDKFVNRIRNEGQANNGLVWVLKNARFAVFSILLSMCFGVEMNEETIEKIDDMMKTVLMTVDTRIDHYLPILSPFFAKQRKEALKVRKEQIKLLLPFIEKRRAILQNPKFEENVQSFSYLDTLFDVKVEGRKSNPTDEEIVTLCSEFLNGGTDTTATAIEWAIGRIIDEPEIQSKIYNEITSTVGDRKVDEKDIEKLVYLQAFVKELLRKHPPTPFSLTHAVIEPATLGGYDIPTDANVEIYLRGISEDPNLWSDPEKFDPDRFASGKEDADITGVKGIKMMPFGVGRRICPGLNMATIHVHLMLARMVQEFEWCINPDQSKIDFTGKVEFTVVMKETLRAVIKPRV